MKAASASSPSNTFVGFLNTEIYPSLMSLLSLALPGLFLSHLHTFLLIPLTLYLALFIHKWFYLHGNKLTRKEGLFWDERALLNTFDACDYQIMLTDECLTPINKDVVQKTGPASILEALLYDQKELDMQKWYLQHYGGQYTWALKKAKERENMKEDKQKKSQQEENNSDVVV